MRLLTVKRRGSDVDSTDKSPALQRIISLCTGAGMLDRGTEIALGGIHVTAICEIEAYAVANLIAKMEAGEMVPAPVWTNLKTFPAKEFHGKIDGIIGGYPCQPFSNAGQREGESDPRHIFPDILRIIESIQPVWCFFENVEGHLSLGFDYVYKSLRNLGYAVEAGIFSASEVGAPHQRKRLFILAHRNSSGSGKDSGWIEQPSGNRWPSRPGEAQQEWEEKRTY